jgi:amino acid transporter
MQLKDNQEALFHHYILDPERYRREMKYLIGTIVALAVFVAWVLFVYADPPRGMTGSIPTICYFIIITQAIYYFVYTCYIGRKVLDVDKDMEEGLHGPIPEK